MRLDGLRIEAAAALGNDGLDIHVVMDNASSHRTKLIRDWFARRPRWHAHFTPTSSSWINQVERFFALLTEQRIRRGAHRSTAELEAVNGESYRLRQSKGRRPAAEAAARIPATAVLAEELAASPRPEADAGCHPTTG